MRAVRRLPALLLRARPRAVRAPLVAALLAATLAGPRAAGTAPDAVPDAMALLDRLETAWQAGDADGVLALWSLANEEDRRAEREFVEGHFGAEETLLQIHRPSRVPAGAPRVRAAIEVFSVTEPRGRIEQWSLELERGPLGWAIHDRQPLAQIDGLVHLSLDATGYRADGLTLRLPDFELRLQRGTLFTSPQSLGPTALVFVGEATVTVSPRPATEREQLRQFCGRPEMVEPVRSAFLRIHPADLHAVLQPVRFEPDPDAAERLPAAQRVFDEHSTRSFLLDANLPRSPWWLLPGLGDASMTFQTRKRGTLTFTVSSEPEGISLFDRAKRKQICLYPGEGQDTDYSEDDGRTVDVLHHDLRVAFDPDRYRIEGESTLKLRLLGPSATLKLRLDEGLAVRSIRSAEGGSHLFFRVRHQNSVMVSLGPLAGRIGDVELTVQYGGYHPPLPIEREVIQAGPQGGLSPIDPGFDVAIIPIEEVLVYTNRTAWYPTAGADDFATADMRFDVPEGYTVLTGGILTSTSTEAGRTLVTYRQDRPGKYITAAVGRLDEVGRRRSGSIDLAGFAVSRARSQGEEMLVLTDEILGFYQQAFGPCPYSNLTLALIEGHTPGGHSPPGMVLLARRPPLMQRMLADDPANFAHIPGFFLAHELAHQWWGHGVAGQNYRERWISEAFAQYAAALWARQHFGEQTFRDILGRMSRWARDKADEGPIHLGHRLGHLRDDPQVYRAVVYDKGAYVLHMLRDIVGEDAFRQALTSFQEKHRFGKAGTNDLRQALEQASGRDLTAYFRDWVYGTELPRLRWSRRTEPGPDGYRTVVEVRAEALPGPVPLDVTLTGPDAAKTFTVTLDPAGGRFTLETPTRPRKVELNETRGLLADVRN